MYEVNNIRYALIVEQTLQKKRLINAQSGKEAIQKETRKKKSYKMKGIREVWNNIKQPHMPTEKRERAKEIFDNNVHYHFSYTML